MDIEMVARNIQIILAPVVMVTSCAILLGGLLARYAFITELLRKHIGERLDLLRRGMDIDIFSTERLLEIEGETPDLLRRHKLAHDAVLAVYCAIAIFILCMFIIAFGAVAQSSLAAMVALLVFLLGTASMLLAVVLTATEVRVSHRAIHDILNAEIRSEKPLTPNPSP